MVEKPSFSRWTISNRFVQIASPCSFSEYVNMVIQLWKTLPKLWYRMTKRRILLCMVLYDQEKFIEMMNDHDENISEIQTIWKNFYGPPSNRNFFCLNEISFIGFEATWKTKISNFNTIFSIDQTISSGQISWKRKIYVLSFSVGQNYWLTSYRWITLFDSKYAIPLAISQHIAVNW